MSRFSLSPTPWPFVGRERELGAIDALSVEPGLAAIVLSGVEGAGTTRLLDESLKRAAASGRAVERFVASRAAASVPFGAFARLLSGTARGSEDHLASFFSALDALGRAGSRQSPVIGVDDAHRLDEAGAALLHQLALTGRALVLATVRAGETAPEPVRALWDKGPGRRIEVSVMSRPATAHLLTAVLRGPVSADAVEDLHGMTQGNLALLHKIVVASLESRALFRADGEWHWEGLDGLASLADLADPRLAELSEPERTVLELVALADGLDLPVLEVLVPDQVLGTLEHEGFLVLAADGRRHRVVLARPVDAHVLRRCLPPLRAWFLGQRLAGAWATLPRRRAVDCPEPPERYSAALPSMLPVDRLTPRERTIVTLAASGLSNREIAHRLYVALRTVENHLYRAFPKLGVTSRQELQRIAGTDARRAPLRTA
jgi:DNA-binding CsgD family transcriptional regulator